MVSRGTFDEEIRQQLRGRGNVNRGDAQQEARDRAARKLNVRSGKNPNPRTSTAYKPDQPKAARKKSKGGGGRKGVPIPGQRPSPMNPNTPDRTKDDPLTPGATMPTVDGPGMEPLIMSLLLQRMIAQKNAGGAGPDMPPQEFDPMYKSQVLPNEVQLQRVPNGPEDLPQLGPPRDAGALSYSPQLALPPPSAAPEAPDNFAVNRFFDQGEIKAMQDAMPGISKMPGMGTSKMPIGPFKRVIP